MSKSVHASRRETARTLVTALLLLALAYGSAAAEGFDYEHKAWNALLRKHVVLLDGGKVFGNPFKDRFFTLLGREQTRRFLSDRSRNRYDPATARLEVSRIFDWYRADWTLNDEKR